VGRAAWDVDFVGVREFGRISGGELESGKHVCGAQGLEKEAPEVYRSAPRDRSAWAASSRRPSAAVA
jgi:hypothetical protein